MTEEAVGSENPVSKEGLGVGGKVEVMALRCPIVDFSGMEKNPDRERISAEVAKACEEYGFFQAINHGVDPSLMKLAKEVAMEFFALPPEEKLKIGMKLGVHFHGYYHPKLSGSTGHGGKPLYEHLYNVFYPALPEHKERWPSNPESFGPTIYQYILESRTLAEQVMGMLSEMLGLEQDAMKKRLAGENGTKSNVHTIWYEPNREEQKVVLLPHHDPGAVTVVFSDEVAALQFETDGQWITIDPIPNALIINLGDQAEVMSNGRFKSGLHRGVQDPAKYRLTIVNFYSPDLDAIIGPLDALLSESNPPLYKSSSYRNYRKTFSVVARGGNSGDPSKEVARALDSFKLLNVNG